MDGGFIRMKKFQCKFLEKDVVISDDNECFDCWRKMQKDFSMIGINSRPECQRKHEEESDEKSNA